MVPLTMSRSRRQSGFTLIEVLVVVAVIAIISAIAIPSMQEAMRKSRQTAALKSMKTLEGGIMTYMLDRDGPPPSLNTRTLEPLISMGYLNSEARGAMLSTLDRGQLFWYYGWSGGGWWDYDYGYAFRPKLEKNNRIYYLWPEGIWLLDGSRWTQVM